MKLKFYTTMAIAVCIAISNLNAQNTFPASGKVGIGTTAPNASSLLEIKSTSKGLLIPRMSQAQRNAIPSPANSLLIYQTDNNPGYYYYNGSEWGNISYWKRNSTGTYLYFNTGNVGIGVGTPAAKLQVDGGTSTSLISPGYIISGNVSSVNLSLDNNEVQARNNGSGSSLYLNYWGGATWLGNHSGTAVPAIYADATGAVGIGSAGITSGYALTVNAGSTTSGISITDPVDNTAINFVKSGINYGAVFSKTSTTSSVETISSSNAGSGAGIYASSVNYLGVYGSSTNYHGVYGYTGGAQVNGIYAGFFSGAVNATGGFYATSDKTLKKNIQDFASAMDIINKLQPKHYEFRNDGDYKMMNLPAGEHYGLIAQDVEKVLPDIVGNTRFDTRMAKGSSATENDIKNSKTYMFKALNYTELIPIIIKGMQEQQQTIQNLNQINELQQQQINQLKQFVESRLGSSDVSSATATLSSATLLQNTPNPYKNSTAIQYNLPAKFSSAQIVVTDNAGKTLKQINISGVGKGSANINAASLAAGTYNYSLLIDGKLIDTKQMVLTK